MNDKINFNNIEEEIEELTKQVISIALKDNEDLKSNIIMIADKFPKYHNYIKKMIEEICPEKLNVFNICLMLK